MTFSNAGVTVEKSDTNGVIDNITITIENRDCSNSYLSTIASIQLVDDDDNTNDYQITNKSETNKGDDLTGTYQLKFN